MKAALILLLTVHGAIHSMGFAKAFGLAEVAQIHQAISRPIGALWLFAALALLTSAALLLLDPHDWRMAAAPAARSVPGPRPRGRS